MTKKQYKVIIQKQSDIIDELFGKLSKYMSIKDFCKTKTYEKMKEVAEIRTKGRRYGGKSIR